MYDVVFVHGVRCVGGQAGGLEGKQAGRYLYLHPYPYLYMHTKHTHTHTHVCVCVRVCMCVDLFVQVKK